MTVRVQSKGEQTRKRIMDLAQDAVLQKGFAATSIDEIIAEAGITKSGFFYHFRDKNDLAKAMLSLPATKGFEIGSGFAGALMRGSEHNDVFVPGADGHVHTATNRSGGTQGGISNGEEIVFRTAFKPTATILQSQQTVDVRGQETELLARGRHDPCVVPRAVVIVEAMTALVLVDHWMRQAAQNQTFKF